MRIVHNKIKVKEFTTLKYNSINEFLMDIRSGNPVLDNELKGWYWDKLRNTLRYEDDLYASRIFFKDDSMLLFSRGIYSQLIDTSISYIKVEVGIITIVLKGKSIIDLGKV